MHFIHFVRYWIIYGLKLNPNLTFNSGWNNLPTRSPRMLIYCTTFFLKFNKFHG
jgi:hypothetical protein